MSTLPSQQRDRPILNLWLRLYAHALLRESRIFPGLELCDESPDCLRYGFADIWKGNYRGEPVCVKVIRTQNQTPLMEIERVCGSFILSEMYSVHSIPDIPSCDRGGKAQPSSERASRHRGFGDIVSTLHHESVDARWEHRPVHPEESGRQSADTGTCPPT